MADILLVERFRLLREGIKAILRDTPDLNVVAEATSGTEALAIVKQRPLALIVTAMFLPGLDGVELTTEVMRYAPSTKVVILTQIVDALVATRAVKAGARAYLLKDSTVEELVECLRTVLDGGCYLSPAVADMLLDRIESGEQEKPARGVETLSRREMQILKYIASGQTNKEIAVRVAIGVQTVRTYRKHLMKKLGVNSVAQMTEMAIHAGLRDMQLEERASV